MLNFCPECGVKLEKDFKFCPNCGSDLREIIDEGGEEKTKLKTSEEEPKSGSNKTIQGNTIICDNCGEENTSGNDVCSGCGAKLKSSGEAKKDTAPLQFVEKRKEKKRPKKSAAPTLEKKVNQPKTLDQKTVLLITAGAIVVILIILFASGVFNSENMPSGNITSQTQSSGVNLENMQKINQLQEQLTKNPSDTHIALQLANLQFDSGLFEAAIKNYKSYLAVHPEDADARVDMGVCYFNLNNDTTAAKEMKTALKYNPKHQIAMMNLGIVNMRMGNMDEAKVWLEKAVKIDPNTDMGKKAQELLKSHNLN